MSINEPMTQEQLDAIQRRVDSATSGPWGCYGDGAHEVFNAGEYSDGDPGEVIAAVIDKLSDAVFIAEAREDVPALLAEVERLRAQTTVDDLGNEAIERMARAILQKAYGGNVDLLGCDVWGVARGDARAALAALLGGGDAAVERMARVIADLEPGEPWPTNADLGGGPTGTRDDEYRHEYVDRARAALAALLGGEQP